MPDSPGRYRARAHEWAWGVSSNNNPQLAVSFEFIDHPGQRMTRYLSFTDDAFDYSLKALRNCGWQGDDFEDLTGLDANEVQLVLDYEEYQGKRELRIAFINQAGGIALKQAMEPTQIASFAQRMKGRIQQADRASGRTPAPKRAADASAPPV